MIITGKRTPAPHRVRILSSIKVAIIHTIDNTGTQPNYVYLYPTKRGVKEITLINLESDGLYLIFISGWS
jgi:hypothetical protein